MPAAPWVFARAWFGHAAGALHIAASGRILGWCGCQHGIQDGPELITLARTRAMSTRIDVNGYVAPKPKFSGRRLFKNYDLA